MIGKSEELSGFLYEFEEANTKLSEPHCVPSAIESRSNSTVSPAHTKIAFQPRSIRRMSSCYGRFNPAADSDELWNPKNTFW